MPSLPARASPPGKVILRFEERPHTLLTLSQARLSQTPEQQQLFARHAYPLTDELYVVLSDNPADWTPINHCCDPNAWWSGLDIVARRPIAEGEEITLEYATFHNELMPEFVCSCPAADCRKVVRGSDYLLPFVAQYAGHVSDYVKTKRMTLAAQRVAAVGGGPPSPPPGVLR